MSVLRASFRFAGRLSTAFHAAVPDIAVRRAKGLDPSSSEAIVIVDKGTPYRLLMEVLFTLGQSEYGKYHLMTMQSKKLGNGGPTMRSRAILTGGR